jgi:hypothetical protein
MAMSFGMAGIKLLREKIADKSIEKIGRMKAQDFTRERKMGMRELIYYSLNKKGLCTNMETNNFFEKTEKEISITSQSLFDQRLKLNPKVFQNLNDTYLSAFYGQYPEEVKTYKGYILKGVDGSDIEIPNTKMAAEKYGTGGNHKGSVARAVVSVSYDLLNHYMTDGIVNRFRTGEIEMAMAHIDRAEHITARYSSIYIMDRNYVSISFMTYMGEKNVKFLCRMKAGSHYIEETSGMETNDEIIEIKHTKNRMQRSRFINEELFQAAKRNKLTRVRVVKFPLKTGEIEYLITNIEDFTYEEITGLYAMRWGIETMYYSLKYKLQIEKFTSSIPQIIEQDILSSLLVYNIIQTTKNESEKCIDQSMYKHEMKINENMAVGFFKNDLIRIMLEDDELKRLNMYDRLVEKIFKFKIPIRKDRSFPVRFKRENKNSFNKLKSY